MGEDDWRLPGRARLRSPHRQAVWLNALHREAVSFKALYVVYDLKIYAMSARVLRFQPLSELHMDFRGVGLKK